MSEKIEMTKEDLQGAVKEIVAESLSKLPKEFSDEQKSEIENSIVKHLEENAVKKDDVEAIVKGALKPLEEVMEEQGKRLNTLGNIEGKSTDNVTVGDFTKAVYEKLTGVNPDEHEGFKHEREVELPSTPSRLTFSTKAWDSMDTISIGAASNTAYPSNGTAANFSEGFTSLYRQLVGGISRRRTVRSVIMDYVSIDRLISNEIIVPCQEWTGEATCTPECELKPTLTANWSIASAKACTVALTWKITRQVLTYYGAAAAQIRNLAAELVDVGVPAKVLSEVKANATPFTPAAGLNPVSNPNNYDGLIAGFASQEMLGYFTNIVFISPVAYANMIITKGNDEHYALQNGNAIKLISVTDGAARVMVEAYDVILVKDPTLGADEVVYGEIDKVKVGLSDEFYYQYIGVTSDSTSDGQRNLFSSVLERDVAVLLPGCDALAVVSTTFTDLKVAVTA